MVSWTALTMLRVAQFAVENKNILLRYGEAALLQEKCFYEY